MLAQCWVSIEQVGPAVTGILSAFLFADILVEMIHGTACGPVLICVTPATGWVPRGSPTKPGFQEYTPNVSYCPTSAEWWANVFDVGSSFSRCWINISTHCSELLFIFWRCKYSELLSWLCPSRLRHGTDAGSKLVHRLRWFPNIGTTSVSCLVFPRGPPRGMWPQIDVWPSPNLYLYIPFRRQHKVQTD